MSIDVCTLIISAWITLQTCTVSPHCTVEGERQFCTGFGLATCPTPEPTYECKRPDGTTYRMKQDKKTIVEP